MKLRDLLRDADRLIAVERSPEAIEIAREAVALREAQDAAGTLAASGSGC